MILRRIIQHFQKQEWTAIAIDFVIVVLGVFVGLQVNNWNEARRDRARGADYAGRLADDLRYEYWRHRNARSYFEQVLDNARRAHSVLTAPDGDRNAAADAALLVSAYRATQYFYTPPRRATFDELVATGDIRLIGDPAMREAAVVIFSNATNETNSEEAKASDYRRMFRRIVPAPVQDALLRQCGDRDADAAELNLGSELDYPCSLDMPDAELSAAAEKLRSSAGLLEALQLRLADLETAIINIDTFAPDELAYFKDNEEGSTLPIAPTGSP